MFYFFGYKCFLFPSADHDTAINRYSRLSKRRDNDKVTSSDAETLLKSTFGSMMRTWGLKSFHENRKFLI